MSRVWVVEASMIRRSKSEVKGNGRYMRSNTVFGSILHAASREKEYGQRI